MIDIHVHLQDPCLFGHIDAILVEAQRLGVQRLVCNATGPADWQAVATLARRFPFVIPCFGIHPWFVADAAPDWEDRLRDLLLSHPSAVGEIGIDRWINPRDEAAQDRLFRQQLQIAHDLRRPAMIHCLRAWGWLTDVLSSQPLPPAILIHSYSGSVDLIKPLCAHNAFFSFSGTVFEPRRQSARDALLAVPPDRLLLETDAPDMLPPPEHRTHTAPDDAGQPRNHPANLPRIYQSVADLLQLPLEQLTLQLRNNAAALLGDLFDDAPDPA